MRRPVQIDLDRARAEAGLSPDADLTLAVVWSSTGANLRATAERVGLKGPGTRQVDLDARLSGADLGGTLLLDTALVLAKGGVGDRPTAPRRRGSVLWTDRRSLRLQGDAPQFPMAIIDFAKTSFPDHAAWHLQISGDLQAATMGSMLLLVNEQNNLTATAFKNASKPRPVDRVVLSAVYADAARIMIEHALRNEDYTDDTPFPEDTLGATLTALFRQLFPGQTVNDLRLRHRQSPSLFSSDLQAAVKIFEVL